MRCEKALGKLIRLQSRVEKSLRRCMSGKLRCERNVVHGLAGAKDEILRGRREAADGWCETANDALFDAGRAYRAAHRRIAAAKRGR